MDIEEDQKPLHLRNAQLLSATPGRADAPTGEGIAIITLGFRGEVEEPFMLCMRDVKKLAISLFAILDHFGDPKAKKVMAFFEELKREEAEQDDE